MWQRVSCAMYFLYSALPQDEQLISETPSSSGSTDTTLMSPLADVVRPTTIEEFVGQDKVVGADSFLRTALKTGDVPSLIFWGPPGCGKVYS